MVRIEIERVEREIEALASAMITNGITLDEAIRELKLNYALQLEEIAERARKSA